MKGRTRVWVTFPRLAACAALAIAVTTAPACAGTAAVHLEWGDCGAAGASVRAFSCDTNSGADVLVLSFVPPGGITDFQGLQAVLEATAPDGFTVPDWWNLSACRAGGMVGSFDFSALPTCTDPYEHTGAGGVAAITSGPLPRFGLAAARPTTTPLDSTVEYYAGLIVVRHLKSAGTGACAGCVTPAGIRVVSLELDGPGSSYQFDLNARALGAFPAYVTWQCSGQPKFSYDFRYGYDFLGWDFPGCVTATRRPTWGAVKSLYR